MPHAVGTLSHAQHHRVVCQIKGQRHEIVRVRVEPRLASVKSSLHLAAVIIEDKFPAVEAARQPGPRHFYLRRFVARHPRIRDRDTHSRADPKFAGRGAGFTYPAL